MERVSLGLRNCRGLAAGSRIVRKAKESFRLQRPPHSQSKEDETEDEEDDSKVERESIIEQMLVERRRDVARLSARFS